MADVKISELDPATIANATDLLETSQVDGPGFLSKRLSLDQVTDLVADSDQVAEVIDAAIGEIPPPPPNDWDSITGKPATFPPTVPIAYTDISGKPATFPPTIPSDVTGWPFLPLAGGTVTGNAQVNGTLGVGGGPGPANFRSGGANGALLGLFAGITRGLRIVTDAVGARLEGVDNTGTASFQPLTLHGTEVNAPTVAYPNNTTKIATTAFVTAALAAGASISVGTTPPGSPSANQLWWNTDASVGGGTLYIFYDSFWVPASPPAGAGSVVQTVSTQIGTYLTTTTTMSSTTPAITEGVEVMTLVITPKSTTSRLIIEVSAVAGANPASTYVLALFRDAVTNALAATADYVAQAGAVGNSSFKHTMVSGTTSPITFRVRGGLNAAGTFSFNGSSGGAYLTGIGGPASSIVIQEVL